jgi:hypothetical protein
MKALAAYALAVLGMVAVSGARAADTPSLTLDLAQSQDLRVEASGVPLEQLLKTLGEQLNFTVDFSPLANRSATVSGTFEGNLDELLADMLRGTNYVARRGPQGVKHLVVMTASSASPGAPPPAQGKTAVAVDIKSASQPAADAVRTATPDAGRTAQAAPAGAPHPPGAGGPPGVVSKLLSTQAGAMLPIDPNSQQPSALPANSQSLGVMTHVAQTNVQALVSALNAACIGPTCAAPMH